MEKYKSMGIIKGNREYPPNLYGKHSSIYIDFDDKHKRRKRKKKKKKNKRSASLGMLTSKSRQLKKYKKRQIAKGRAKSVVSSNSHIESVSDYMIHFTDRYSTK